ncbi:MAG: right-handed parallel beta-helix repeat-containing protein, partial [Candidatus Aenigmarchaeota archaeon]|nr:right-handed parallel beta-helix repeat-containing protein [Candidatus Aenigmarchaeota archaeon]
CRNNEYSIEFRSIVTNATGTINGTINYAFTPTTNSSPITSISLCNDSIGCYDVYINDSGYYTAYVSPGTYNVCAGSDRPDAMLNCNNSVPSNSTCDFTLQNGSVIAGSVFNATSNKSIAHIGLRLWNSSYEWGSDTNDYGYYSMHVPVSGNYTLELRNYLSNQLDISDIGQGNCSVHNLIASEDTGAPVIYLLSPDGTTYDATNNVTFIFNVTDDLRIANCSLWTNVSGNWSRDVIEWDIKNNKNNSFTRDNISNGHYIWNIECTDDSPNHNTNFSQNGNFTFTVKYITCGDNITEDTVLTQDLLNCSSGLNIGADNIMLDCNGHTVSGTLSGQQFHGIFAEGRDNITIKNCIISNYLNSSAIYLNQTHNSRLDNNTVLDSGSGIVLENSTNNNVTNNRVNDTNWAISLWQSSHLNRIINNTLACGGVFLNSGDNNTLSNNTIHNNNGTGIYLEDCFDNIISNNTVYNNTDEGIYLKSSDGNLIYNNYLNNTFNAYDNGTNYWNTTYQNGTGSVIDGAIGGNFFPDYTGWDNTGDRIGNTANYTISGGDNVDCLPLTLNSDTTPPNVSSITPTSGNEDTQINFTANVSDDVNVTSCNLYIGGVDNGS